MTPQRLRELADRYFRDELTVLERIELQKILEQPDETCKEFMDELYDTGLIVMVGKNIALQPNIRDIKPVRYKLAAGIAALLAIGIFSFFMQKQPAEAELAERRPLLAKLTTIHANKPNQDTLDVWIQSGKYNVPSGKHQLLFTNGIKVNLIGPAEFELIDEKNMLLNKGSIIAKVSKEARTFTVMTPSASIVDLGTIFQVKVNDLFNTNVYVRQGIVQVTSTIRGGSKVLGKKESIRVLSNGDFQEIENQEEVFNLEEESPEAMANRKNLVWMHWDFENNLQAIDQTSSTNPISELIPKNGSNSMPKVCESPYGKGMRFDGQDDGLISEYRGIGGNEPRTVSLWVRLNPGTKLHRRNCFVYWGNHFVDGRKWQITTNQIKDHGPLQALRVELRQGHLVGSTPINDGRWHHIAVVFIGGYTSDVATHVMLYVDGTLDKITDYRSKIVDTDISSSQSDPLHVGLYHGENPLNGDIDELWIFNQALMNDEIIRLRDFNSPFDNNLN